MEQVGSGLYLTKEYLQIAGFKNVWENSEATKNLHPMFSWNNKHPKAGGAMLNKRFMMYFMSSSKGLQVLAFSVF